MTDDSFIKELEIKNFKCLSDNRVNLNSLTILAGSNSVGKSSFIQALLLIRQTIDRLSHVDSTSSKEYAIQLNGPYHLNLGNITQVLSSNAESSEIVFALRNQNGSSVFRYFLSKDKPELILKFQGTEHKWGENPTTTIFARGFYYLNAERLGPRTTSTMINQDFDTTGSQGEYTGYILAKNEKFRVEESRQIQNNSNQTVPFLNKQTEYWMDYIIPGIEMSTTAYRDLNLVGCNFWRTFSDTEPLNPNNVGFGISYVLPVIVSGLIAEKNSLLIVENPEAHLHPRGQSRIGQFLAQVAASGVQVIIETHSEHVINGIRISTLKKQIPYENVSINFFNMSGKGIKSEIELITMNNKARLSKWPCGFFDQEESDLAEIFERSNKC